MPTATIGRDELDSIDLSYGRALLELAKEAGQLEVVAQDVDELAKLVQDNEELARLIDARTLARAQRRDMLERLFDGRVHPTLYSFIQVVNSKNRLHQLGRILRGFQKLLAVDRGMLDVHAFVARALDSKVEQELAQRIGQARDRTVVLHQHVDPALIGGLKLRIGDELIDGTVATQLKLMKQRMIEAGRESAGPRAEGRGPRGGGDRAEGGGPRAEGEGMR